MGLLLKHQLVRRQEVSTNGPGSFQNDGSPSASRDLIRLIRLFRDSGTHNERPGTGQKDVCKAES